MDFFADNWPEITAIAVSGLAFVVALLAYIAPKTKNTYDDKALELLVKLKDALTADKKG